MLVWFRKRLYVTSFTLKYIFLVILDLKLSPILYER